jgi:hypothetical protein
MGEIAINFVFLVLSLSLAVVGTVVGAWLQHRSWKHQQWEKLREDRTQAALATVERASQLIDRRLYRQRRLLWAVRRGLAAEIEVEKDEYRSAVFQWMDNLGRTKAELWVSFDQWTAISFEDQLHDPFARNGARIERALRTRQGTRLSEEERELNRLGRSSYEFMQQLLGRIQREEINGLVGRYELSYRNWENLTSGFLLARLFGLAAAR